MFDNLVVPRLTNLFPTPWYDKIAHKTSLDQYLIRSTKIKRFTSKEVMELWDVRDEKEEYLNGNSRSREREADKIKALDIGQDPMVEVLMILASMLYLLST